MFRRRAFALFGANRNVVWFETYTQRFDIRGLTRIKLEFDDNVNLEKKVLERLEAGR